MKLSHDTIRTKLKDVQQPTPINTLILQAIHEKTGLDALEELKEKVLTPLKLECGVNWAQQFRSDVAVYGLAGAIEEMCFYTPTPSSRTVKTALKFFRKMSKAYNGAQLNQSQNPKIRLLLEAGRLRPHAVKIQRELRPAMRSPQPAAEPERDVAYECRLPEPEIFESMPPWLQGGSGHGSFVEELWEHIQANLMIDFPRSENMFFVACEMMENHGVLPQSSEGQWILSMLILGWNQDVYGPDAYDAMCDSCGGEFRVESLSLGSVNHILEIGTYQCKACAEEIIVK